MNTKNNATNVVALETKNTKEEQLRSEKKWGKAVIEYGFCIFPSLLLKAQGSLGIKPQELAVLLQIIDHWWMAGEWPYPSKKTLADRLNISPRQVQRHIESLETSGFLKRIERRGKNNEGRLSNKYDLSGLVSELQKLEPDFTKVKKDAADSKREIEKPRSKRNK